ncbi:MAG TPA: hypothetical protein VLX09_02485 [Stellaceae bacterium]|nr:hypothetical protein [Stellaceae bacterium]
MTDDDLSQADLSQLSLRQMTPAQRAELKRRYQIFVANFQPDSAAKLPAAAAPKPKKWVPGKKKP